MEQETRQEQGGGKLGYILLGAAAGAALGILYAPKAGEETRELVGDWIKKRQDKLPQFFAKVKQELPFRREQLGAALKAGKEAYFEIARTHNNSNSRKSVRA